MSNENVLSSIFPICLLSLKLFTFLLWTRHHRESPLDGFKKQLNWTLVWNEIVSGNYPLICNTHMYWMSGKMPENVSYRTHIEHWETEALYIYGHVWLRLPSAFSVFTALCYSSLFCLFSWWVLHIKCNFHS